MLNHGTENVLLFHIYFINSYYYLLTYYYTFLVFGNQTAFLARLNETQNSILMMVCYDSIYTENVWSILSEKENAFPFLYFNQLGCLLAYLHVVHPVKTTEKLCDLI